MLNTCSIGRRWKSREGWSRPVLTGERGTLFPIPLGDWVSSCGGFLVGWQGTLFLVVAMTILVRRLICLRPLSGSRTATTGIGRVAGSVAGRSRLGVGRSEWFCGGHGPGETPGPFPNPEAKAWHGDGTALERVWESSAPPHSTLGVPVELRLREPPFFVCCAGQPAGARCPGCRKACPVPGLFLLYWTPRKASPIHDGTGQCGLSRSEDGFVDRRQSL